MDGIVLVNKPQGITSYDVVRTAKKVFNTSKIGHTGTLDPFAEGLMILCINKATKIADKLLNINKSYDGVIVFGAHYDTYDVTGKILETNSKIVDLEELKRASMRFVGNYDQMPPVYSAIKKDGKKLYQYARQGIEVTIEKRNVEITKLDILSELTTNTFTFATDVSKGTYIRSLAVDLANSLQTVGALKSLRRTKIGNYKLEDAVELEKLSVNDLVSVEVIYQNNPKITVSEYLSKLVKNGIRLDERQIETDENFLVYDHTNKLIAVYEVVGKNQYKPLIIL